MNRASPRTYRRAVWVAVLTLAGGGVVGVAIPPVSGVVRQAQDGETRQGAVTTVDGRVIEGIITERADEVIIEAGGIVTPVPRSQVRSVDYGDARERLKVRLRAAGDDNDAILAVAREALRKGLLDVADEAADAVLVREPGNRQARDVLDQVQRQRQLDRTSGTGTRRAGRETADDTDDDGPATRPARADRDVPRGTPRGSPRGTPPAARGLTEDQINRVRQAELQEADATARTRPRIQFRDNVVRRYVDSRPDLDFREFNRLDDVTKALTLLAAGDEFRDDVVVASDPNSILNFKRTIQPFVTESCATSECHGGPEHGGFFLYRQPRDDAHAYANFVQLATWTVETRGVTGGAFGDGPASLRLIDRDNPDASLLLTYFLPPARTTTPHPPAEGFRARWAGPDAPPYRTVRSWIANDLTRFRPDYGFDFDPLLEGAADADEDTEDEAGGESEDE